MICLNGFLILKSENNTYPTTSQCSYKILTYYLWEHIKIILSALPTPGVIWDVLVFDVFHLLQHGNWVKSETKEFSRSTDFPSETKGVLIPDGKHFGISSENTSSELK